MRLHAASKLPANLNSHSKRSRLSRDLFFFPKQFLLAGVCLLSSSLFAQNADISLLRRTYAGGTPTSINIAKGLSHSIYPVSFGIPLGQAIYGFSNKDKDQQWNALSSAGSILLASAISTGLKYAVDRPRPYATYPDIKARTHSGPFSFPSGHTTVAFASATALTLAYPKWYVAVPAYTYAGAVAWSRMHLGMHYPSDIIAGMLIGAGSSFLMYKAQHWIR